MPNISRKPARRYGLVSRLIFWAQKWKYGKTLEPAWQWGRSPALMFGLQIFYRCLDRKSSPLSPALRALVSNRVAELNHCDFCMDISRATLQRETNRRKLSALSEKEKAALEFAELVTVAHRTLTPTDFQRIREFFTEDEVVELTAWICFQNMSSKFNAALDVPSQGFSS